MSIIGVLIAGIIVGLLGKFVVGRTRSSIPLWLTIMCGIGGVILGWFFYGLFVGTGSPGIDWIRWLISIIVAAVLVIVANAILRRRRRKRAEKEARTIIDRATATPTSPKTTERGNAPSHKSRGIFLSYRREDSAPYARLLQLQLTERFPTTEVFLDLDSIEAGRDFAEVIQRAVNTSVVLIALIGHQWTTIVDEQGRRRLDKPDDYVRYEIQTALEHGLRVIPVLVDGAKPLRREDVPSQLQGLIRLNALELSYGRYQYDADRLLGVIERVLVAPGAAPDALGK